MFGFKKAQKQGLRTTGELIKAYTDLAVNPRVVLPSGAITANEARNLDALLLEQKRQQRELNYARIRAIELYRANRVTTESEQCPCCRSFDYVWHNKRQQCAYCRVPRRNNTAARERNAQGAYYRGMLNAYNPEGYDTSGTHPLYRG